MKFELGVLYFLDSEFHGQRNHGHNTASASPNGLETPSGALFYGYLFINGTLVDQGSGTGYGGFTFSVTV